MFSKAKAEDAAYWMASFVSRTGESYDVAFAYLDAEEWSPGDALRSYRGDRLAGLQTKVMAAPSICGATIKRLMRRNGKTIAGIAARWDLTQARVREVRANGVRGEAFCRDWLEILTTP